MLLGLHHTANVSPSWAVVSAIFVGLKSKNGECWCGVHGKYRFESCLVQKILMGEGPRQSGQTSHQFCRHIDTGVNARKTTSLERAKWELITLSGGNTVLKVFPLLSPPLL